MDSTTLDTFKTSNRAKRWLQCSYAERCRVYHSRAGSKKDLSQRIKAPFHGSHVLNQVVQCQSQQLARRRVIYGDQRQKLYDQRNAACAALEVRIKNSPPSESKLLQVELDLVIAKFMKQIQRYNFGPTELVGAPGIPIPDVVAISTSAEQEIADELESGLTVLAFQLQPLVGDSPWPPGTSIRTSPIIPGAPFATLPH